MLHICTDHYDQEDSKSKEKDKKDKEKKEDKDKDKEKDKSDDKEVDLSSQQAIAVLGLFLGLHKLDQSEGLLSLPCHCLSISLPFFFPRLFSMTTHIKILCFF